MDWRAGFIKWCEDEIAKMRKQLEMFESGSMHIGRRHPGGVTEDLTPGEIQRLKRSIADLVSLIARVRAEIGHA